MDTQRVQCRDQMRLVESHYQDVVLWPVIRLIIWTDMFKFKIKTLFATHFIFKSALFPGYSTWRNFFFGNWIPSFNLNCDQASPMYLRVFSSSPLRLSLVSLVGTGGSAAFFPFAAPLPPWSLLAEFRPALTWAFSSTALNTHTLCYCLSENIGMIKCLHSIFD